LNRGFRQADLDTDLEKSEVSNIPFAAGFRNKKKHTIGLADYVGMLQSGTLDKLPDANKSYWFTRFETYDGADASLGDRERADLNNAERVSPLGVKLRTLRALLFKELGIDKEHATVESTQHILGPRFTGAPSHTHGRAINLVFHGSKRWYLSPTRDGARHNAHPSVYPGSLTMIVDSLPTARSVEQPRMA
jgi:hypothetical protein